MNSKAARISFYGNLKRVGDGDWEKQGLYFGLAKLAEAVSDVDRRVQLLRQEVAALRSLIEDVAGRSGARKRRAPRRH